MAAYCEAHHLLVACHAQWNVSTAVGRGGRATGKGYISVGEFFDRKPKPDDWMMMTTTGSILKNTGIIES